VPGTGDGPVAQFIGATQKNGPGELPGPLSRSLCQQARSQPTFREAVNRHSAVSVSEWRNLLTAVSVSEWRNLLTAVSVSEWRNLLTAVSVSEWRNLLTAVSVGEHGPARRDSSGRLRLPAE